MIARVFARRTSLSPRDDLAFYGGPPLGLTGINRVLVSAAFSWDQGRAKFLARQWDTVCQDVRIGGPGFGNVGGEFTPGLFLQYGVTITSRGCPRRCPWCVVPQRDGRVRTLKINAGWIVQDDNLLACPRPHIEAVLEMLASQPDPIDFAGGLDARLLDQWFCDRLAKLRVFQAFVAYDQASEREPVLRSIPMLQSAGLAQRAIRVYMLCGFGDDTPSRADDRAAEIFAAGAVPFAQWYQDGDRFRPAPDDWQTVIRKWSRPAAMFARKVSDERLF